MSNAVPNAIEKIHIIDAVFLARRDIRSLPDWHAARWSGWLRYACARMRVPLDAILLGLLPLRNGKSFIRQGESLILRLIVKASGLAHLVPKFFIMGFIFQILEYKKFIFSETMGGKNGSE